MPPRVKKTTPSKGAGVGTAAQNVVRRAVRAIKGPKNIRMLVDGEGPHLPNTNFAGPGTNLAEAEKAGPTNAVDRIARIHDYAYEDASQLTSREERMKAYHIADEVMEAQLKALPASERGLGSALAKIAISGKKWVEETIGVPLHDPVAGGAVKKKGSSKAQAQVVSVKAAPVSTVGKVGAPTKIKKVVVSSSGELATRTFNSSNDIIGHLATTFKKKYGDNKAFIGIIRKIRSNRLGYANELMLMSEAELTRHVQNAINNEGRAELLKVEEQLYKALEKQAANNDLIKRKPAAYEKIASTKRGAATRAINAKVKLLRKEVATRSNDLAVDTDFDYLPTQEEEDVAKEMEKFDEVQKEYHANELALPPTPASPTPTPVAGVDDSATKKAFDAALAVNAKFESEYQALVNRRVTKKLRGKAGADLKKAIEEKRKQWEEYVNNTVKPLHEAYEQEIAAASTPLPSTPSPSPPPSPSSSSSLSPAGAGIIIPARHTATPHAPSYMHP